MRIRTGKIARLPKAVRDRLNQRLADGVPGEQLLDWLHSQPDVLEVLVRDFEGRPILKQNLSEWRQGGFREWEARQERLEKALLLCEEADDVQEVASRLPDQISAILATRFASAITATAHVKDWSKPRQRAQLMEMCEGVATLRRFDQGAARLKLEHEQLEMKKAELELAREAQRKRTEAEWREWTRAYNRQMFRDCKTPEEAVRVINRFLFGHDDEEMIREERKKWHEKAGLPLVPEDATLFEKAASLLQTQAIAEQLAANTAQESQAQSNPVKP